MLLTTIAAVCVTLFLNNKRGLVARALFVYKIGINFKLLKGS